MKQIVATLIITLCTVFTGNAQSFTQDIQQKDPTKGKVTIHESTDIDDLVNGKTPPAPTKVPEQKNPETSNKQPVKETASEVKTETKTTEEPKEENTHKETEKKERKIVRKVREDSEEDANTSKYNRQKKVMKGGQLVNGYRILVYSGSNREGKQRAQAAGQKVKGKYPSQPVFVHFNSPYWQCHVGNFRERNEAQKILNGIKGLGYSQACIVSTKIRVQ